MLKKMAMRIGEVSLVLAAVMFFASLSSIMLGRLLPEKEFGEFSLMRQLLLFVPFIAIWGQGIATARYFSLNDVRRFDWPKAYKKILLVSSGLVVVCVAVCWFIYKLDAFKLMALLVASVFFCSTLFLSNLVRSQQRYSQAILMENSFRGIFFFLVLLIYFTLHIDRNSAILAYSSIIVLLGLFNIRYAFGTVPRGTEPVPNEMHSTGLILMGIEVSIDILSSLDALFIPKMLGYEALAVYSAALVPAQAFNILARAAKYVWVPEFGRSQRTRFKALSVAVAVVALVLSLVLICGAQPLLHLLYKGKYDAGAPVLRILALAGIFRLFYGLSSSLIVGRLGKSALVYHLRITILSLFVYMLSMYWFLHTMGIIGAAWALLFITIFRAVLSYWVVYKFRPAAGATAEAPLLP